MEMRGPQIFIAVIWYWPVYIFCSEAPSSVRSNYKLFLLYWKFNVHCIRCRFVSVGLGLSVRVAYE
jgi:hypothetical protein